MNEQIRYLVEMPFKGYIESLSSFDNGQWMVDVGRYDYKLGKHIPSIIPVNLYIADLKQRENIEVRLVDDVELYQLIQDFNNSLITNPEEISIERWEEMLEVLPPCRWNTYAGYSGFHVSERYTGDLVSWYFKKNGKAYTFMDSCFLTYDQIAAKLATIHND